MMKIWNANASTLHQNLVDSRLQPLNRTELEILVGVLDSLTLKQGSVVISGYRDF